MAPDTQQNLSIALALLFKHNGLAIVFLSGILASIGYALYRPCRGAILLIVGFALLLFAFEYEKHISGPLIEQTSTSLITERESWRLAWIIKKVLGKLVTPALYMVGVALLGIGAVLLRPTKTRTKKLEY
ncbi:MAG: hypothetical protein N2691_01650 [Patescibacteria group bacterium]|nr:hypothetical protein [Patescibacteria group bacterium]